MSKERLVPKRRFKGFEEEWETKSLLDIGNIVMGHSPKSINYTSNPNDHILVQGNADIKNHRIHPRLWTTEITQTAKKGDIILTVRAPVGEVAKTNYEVVLGRGVSAIEGNEYLFQYLLKLKANNYWGKLSSGSTFDSINSDDIKNLIINIPNIGEQQKIGRFFKLLDKRIANQEGKIAKLKDIKSAYLTEMFPKEGETVPKRRFKGFEEDWSLVTVRDLAQSYYNGGTPRTSISEYWNGDIPWIQSSDLSEDIITITKSRNSITKLGLQMSAAKLIPKNSIAVVTRVGVGKLAFIPYEYTTSQDFLSLSDLVNEPYFTTYVLYDLLKRRKNSVQGTSIKGMTKDELLSWSLFIAPNYKEQQKIGAFFKNLDNQIDTEEKKLAKLKAMKEAYLEEMFV